MLDLWAGPLTAVFGGELRWESQDSRRDELTATLPYRDALIGNPLLDQLRGAVEDRIGAGPQRLGVSAR